MDIIEIIDILRGEGGVIALLALGLIAFFRGGIVTGKAHESAIANFREQLKSCEDRTARAQADGEWWRSTAMRATEAGESMVRRER